MSAAEAITDAADQLIASAAQLVVIARHGDAADALVARAVITSVRDQLDRAAVEMSGADTDGIDVTPDDVPDGVIVVDDDTTVLATIDPMDVTVDRMDDIVQLAGYNHDDSLVGGVVTGWALIASWAMPDGHRWLTSWKPEDTPMWETRGMLAHVLANID